MKTILLVTVLTLACLVSFSESYIGTSFLYSGQERVLRDCPCERLEKRAQRGHPFCRNGGSCVCNEFNFPQCQCADGVTGIHCDITTPDSSSSTESSVVDSTTTS